MWGISMPMGIQNLLENIIQHLQGCHSNQCHHAMARVDLLPRPLLTYIYWAPRKKDSLNPRSGTGCFYLLLAPMNIFHDQTMPFSKMKLWLILKLSLVCWLNLTPIKNWVWNFFKKKGLSLKCTNFIRTIDRHRLT